MGYASKMELCNKLGESEFHKMPQYLQYLQYLVPYPVRGCHYRMYL
jgi:hypothetical protein